MPCSAAWSGNGPCSTVSTGSTSDSIPSKRASRAGVTRPRTRISYWSIGGTLAHARVNRDHPGRVTPSTRTVRRVGATMGLRLLPRMLATLVLVAATLILLEPIVPGYSIDSFGDALIAAALGGLANTLLWPLIVRITLPLNVLTLGLAALVLNGLVTLGVAAIAPGVHVNSLGSAIVLGLALTAVSTAVAALFTLDDDRRVLGPVVRRSRNRHRDPNAVPGVLFLEIDGLAHDVLQRALRDGNAPALASWVRTGSHRLHEWETDWSSQTGACQAGILHGSNHDMPAFRWWEKDRGAPIVTNHPRDAAELERRISDGHGLLYAGGASRANILSGDAPHSLLTMSTVLDHDRQGRLGQDYFTYFSGPFNAARTFVRVIAEVVTELVAAAQQRRLDV